METSFLDKTKNWYLNMWDVALHSPTELFFMVLIHVLLILLFLVIILINELKER